MSKVFPLLVAASIVLSTPSWSQKKLNLSVFTGSGISFFAGPGAVNKSNFSVSGSGFNTLAIMANPYGKKQFTNFIAGLQADITPSSTKWILILSSQYEQTGGELSPDSVFSSGVATKTVGKYKRYYNFISVDPQIGRILFQKKVIITFHAGLDYAFKVTEGEQFDYTNQTGQTNSIGYEGGYPKTTDFRITFGTSITLKKWSLDFNFKHGLSNYNKNGNAKVLEKLLHIRLLYTFLKI